MSLLGLGTFCSSLVTLQKNGFNLLLMNSISKGPAFRNSFTEKPKKSL